MSEEKPPNAARSERLGKAKGVIVRPMIDWFASTFGKSGLDELAATLDPRWAAELVLDGPALGIAPGGWYDERLASALAARIVAIASTQMPEAEALRAIGKVTVDRSLGRISRAVIEWVASPDSAAMSAQLSWRLYHSTGWISASVSGSAMHAVGIWGAHGEKWCAVVGACTVRVLELIGREDVRFDRHVCSGGARSCEVTVRWSPR